MAFPQDKTEIVQDTPAQKLTVADFPSLQTQEVLTLHINGKQLPFPLPNMSPYKYVWIGSSTRAPFLNREQIVMALLQAAYSNFLDPNQKPAYAVQTMNPGSGKTRLLIEWSYHALNDPQIIEKFLSGNWRGVKGTLTDRQAFVNALYKTVFMQRMIIISSSSQLSEKNRKSKLIR